MNHARIFIGIILIVLGVSWLFGLPLFQLILPVFLIWLGVRVIRGKSSDYHLDVSRETSTGLLRETLIFTGINKKIISKDFTGGDFTCIFAGGEIDLGDVTAKNKQVIIDTTVIFGGLKIIIPPTWSVTNSGVGIIGGYDIKLSPSGSKEPAIKLVLKGVTVLGGVEITSAG